MEILPIHPDEWLAGYFGRIAAINNCFKQDQLINRIRSSLSQDERDLDTEFKSTHLDLLAATLGLTLSTFVYDHTLFKLFKAFPIKAQAVSDANLIFTVKQMPFVERPLRKEVWFCRACVDEDRKSYLFSYWRRSHQVPGVFECAVHNTALSRVEYKGLLNFTPDSCHNPEVTSDETMVRIRGQSWISSTLKILHLLLEADSTIGQKEVVRLLRSKSGFDTCTSKTDFFAKISSDLISNIPAEWLIDYMPRVQRDKGDYATSVNSAFKDQSSFQRSPPATTVALMAAHYWPTDQAAEILIPEAWCSTSP